MIKLYSISTEGKNKMKQQEDKREERRGFLKKAVYATPTILALGELLKPQQAQASFNSTPSDPDTASLDLHKQKKVHLA